MTAPWTIARVLEWTIGFFREKGIEQPRLDAELLIADALGVDRMRIYLDHHKPLHPDELTAVRERVRRRGRHEPVAYITGQKGFWSLDLAVDARVLVPRPDTERLVERAIERLKGRDAPRIVDVGCGSGAIALALAHERPDATVIGVDRSPDALDVSRANAAALGLDRVEWRRGDLLAGLAGPFDLVAANPPYIPSADIDALMPDVARYEPRAALDGGPDGLDLVRRLIPEAAERLTPGGALLVEIGHDQGPAARALAEADGRFEAVQIVVDYGRNDRVLEATRSAR
ncbi:MAG: peptide chain release factor N(5)-glutamine methyltransferase [Myxococcales bacterium]|nr:peptide chain release factor N(5)-glutamine methyltransferase [Myxococcales bacterium]MCB9541571.1 peptide chain release factor N(5)-glutamine methyltransferase [Myxococcales bacterium]MCB9552160.1 peptide chain release factor N(5)-glutamine methyltransferase [Myxococcales bacterium]